MAYRRTGRQKGQDLANARALEDEIQKYLPDGVIVRTDSKTELDFFVPGCFVEVKGKFQPLGERWTKLVAHVPETDLFVLDELSVRKAAKHWPFAWLMLHTPDERWHIASVVELVSIPRVRVNRETSPNMRKGKWLLDLRELREIDPATTWQVIRSDIESELWSKSECISMTERVGDV